MNLKKSFSIISEFHPIKSSENQILTELRSCQEEGKNEAAIDVAITGSLEQQFLKCIIVALFGIFPTSTPSSSTATASLYSSFRNSFPFITTTKSTLAVNEEMAERSRVVGNWNDQFFDLKYWKIQLQYNAFIH